MQCPFLNRFTASFIRNYAETLCQSYGSHCPVVGKTLGAGEKKLSLVAASVTRSYSTGANANAGAAAGAPASADPVKATSTSETFPYERFFNEQIMKKKRDHSYRVFKKVNRLAGMSYYNGSNVLPSTEEMLKDTYDRMTKLWQDGYRKRHAHMLGPRQVSLKF